METVWHLTEPANYDGTGRALEGDVFPGHDFSTSSRTYSQRKRYFVLRVALYL